MAIIQQNYNNIFENKLYPQTLKQNHRQKSSVSFGYDKQLNNKVQTMAAAADFQEILVLQNMCNALENDVRDNEDSHDVDFDKYNDVFTKLVPLKVALTKLIEYHFPTLCYANKESKHYYNEASDLKDKEIHVKAGWRSSMANAVEEALDISVEDLGDFIGDDDVDGQSQNFYSEPVKKVEGVAKNDPDSIINMFVPNEFTPKGFADVAGMDDIKDELKYWIIDPIKKPEEVSKRKQYGIKMPNGFMLYGPPGCGKTFIAEALAVEAGVPLFKLKISEAGSKFIHESSKNYRLAFDKVEQKANELKKPCILFIDEIDSVANSRDSLSGNSEHKKEEVNTLLDLLGSASARGIIVLAATNNPGGVDKAIKRSGRFDKEFYVGLPDANARLSKIKLDLTKRQKAQDLITNEKELSEIVKLTDGFSNSDIDVILESAAMKAMKKDDNITLNYVIESVDENKVKKLTPDDLKKYDNEPIKRPVGFATYNA